MRVSLFILLVFIKLNCLAQKTYYISNNGNDKNDGTSPKRPLKTIVNLERGSTYLLKRGNTFYFNIKAIIKVNGLIKIDAYGKGKKPVISLYKNIKSTAWRLSSDNIWKIDLKNTENFTGFMNTENTNVGFLKIGTSIKGNKVNAVNKLKKQWDFYSDQRYLYVFSSASLSTLKVPVKVTTKHDIILLSNNMQVSNLFLTGTGGHAIQGTHKSNIVIKNVTISEIGGSYLSGFKNGETRYGNGIEIGGRGSNYLIDGCYVTQVYDAAYTMQSTDTSVVFENIIFNNNTASNNEQSFEFWTSNTRGEFKNCKFINNYCSNAGFGWSHEVRPDKNAAVHLLNYYHGLSDNDLIISGNTFTKAKTGYIFIRNESAKGIMFKSFNNKIFLDKGVPIINTKSKYKVSDGKPFTETFGLEKGSLFKILKN